MRFSSKTGTIKGSSGYLHLQETDYAGNAFTSLLARKCTISCSTLQLKRSMTASSQSLSSFSTCSIAFSASLYCCNASKQTGPQRVRAIHLLFHYHSSFYLPSYPWEHYPDESILWASQGPAELPVQHLPGPAGTAPSNKSNRNDSQKTYNHLKMQNGCSAPV